MHIVFTRFPYQSAFGGEEYHTLDVAKYFVSQGHSVSFFGSCSALLAMFAKSRLPYKRIYFPRAPVSVLTLCYFIVLLPILWPYVLTLYLLRYKTKPVCLYALSLPDKLLLTPIVRLCGGKVIWLEHQYIGNWLQKSPLRYWYTLLSKRVTLVPISQANANVLVNALHVSQEHVVHILHGINIKTFAPNAQTSVPGLCVYSGRIEPEKGIVELLEAFAKVYKQLPHARLILRGKGSLEPFVKAFVAEHSLQNCVTLQAPGSFTEYLQLLQQAECAILASKTPQETFSLFIAEAVSSGAKPVVTTVCGIASTLDPRLAEVVVPNSSALLADAILRSMQNTVSKSDLHNFAKATYNQQRMFTEYAQLV